MAQEKDSSDKFFGLRQCVEDSLNRNPSDVADVSTLSPEEAQRLVHELRVHQIELEMQNEDLRQAQIQLEELKDRYLDLYDFAPVGYVTLNDKGLILEANLTAVRLLGEESRTLINRPFSRFVCREFGDAYYLYLLQVFETQSKQTCEIELTSKDGTRFYAQLESVAVQDENGQFSRCRIIVTDISERKSAEEVQRESEDRYRDLVENIQDFICTHDLQGKLLFVNQASATVVGYSPADLVGTDLRSYLAPEVRDRFDAYLAAIRKDGQANGLMFVRTKSGEKRIWEYHNTLRTEGPGQPIVRGIARDITERKKMEESLREAERRYRRLFEQAPSMYVITRSEQGGPFINDCNELFLTCVGYTREEVQGKPLADFYSPESRTEMLEHEGYARALAGEFFIGERELVRRDGSLIPTLLYTATEVDPSGRVTGTRAMFVDITERKKVEEALRQSEERNRFLAEVIDHSSQPFGMGYPDGRLGIVNKAFCDLTGYGEEELRHIEWNETLTPPEWRESEKRHLTELERTGKPVRYEKEYIRKDGTRVPIELLVHVVRGETGEPLHYRSFLTDLTERKKMEEALRQSESMLRGVLHASPIGIGVVSDRKFKWTNEFLFKMTGYSQEELMGQSARILYENDEEFERVGAVKYHQINLTGTGTGTTETKWKRKDGTIIDIILSSTAIDPQHLAVGVVFTAMDMTERKQAEEALRDSESRLSSYLSSINEMALGVFVVDRNYKVRHMNHIMVRWFGDHSGKVCYESVAGLSAPCPYCRLSNVINESKVVHYEPTTPDGRTFRIVAAPVRENDGSISKMEIIADITDRKRTEEALRESEERFRLAMEATNDGVWDWDLKTNQVFRSPGFFSMLGYGDEDFSGRFGEWQNLVHPEDLASALQALNEYLDGVRKHFEAEFRMIDKSGGTVWILSRGKVVARDENGQPLRMIGTHTNITEGKKLDEALRASEERYRGIFDNAAVGIDVVDAAGKLQQVNHSFAQMLGYSMDELLNMTILDITHPEDVEESKYRHRNMVEGKTDAYRFEKRYVRKDGEVFWADVSVSPVKGPDGGYESTIGVVSDITARTKAEESLFAAKRDWEDTFNSINELITIHDKDFNIIQYNKAAKRLLGLPSPVIADAIKCYQYYHGKDCPPELCPSCTCLETRRQAVSELYEPYLDRFIEITAIPRFAADGGLSGLIHVVRDITERKISEELTRIRLDLLEYSATHSLVELLRKTLDEIGALTNSPIGFYHLISEDERTICLQMGSSGTMNEFCTADGIGRQYPVDQGEVWTDAIRERRPVILNDYAALPHGKGLPEGHAPVTRELVVPIMRADKIVAVLGVGNKPADYGENDIEIVSHLADVAWEITERKRTEDALKEKDKQYRTLFEDSIDGVYSVLRDGTITDANPAFCEVFGYEREEMIGKDIRDLYLDPADRPRFQEEIEKTGFVKDYELKLQKSDGTEVDCLISSSVMFEEDGSIIGYRGIIRDLTARKALQNQLQQAQKMEAVGTLAGGIAHDFNNLLQVVLGYSELVLAEEDLPDRFRNDLEKVHLAARSGAELVQRLLTFSRKTETKPLDLDLNQRITQTQKFLQRTIPKMITIEMMLAEDLARIHADPTQIDQVLMNLAVNARDAMPEGGRLVIETANVLVDEDSGKALLGVEPGGYVLLSVSDTGHGMDKGTLDRIFEPFYTTKDAGKGTGLGLAMVYGIVHRHGGHITCYSEPGEGTTFKMYFPAVEMEMKPDLGTTGIMPAFGTETILLVDDEGFVRDLGKRILERSGYTVLTAVNGKEALDLYKREREKISLVILDLIMPEMGGKQCLEELCRINPRARVLIASGYSPEVPTKEAPQGGARGFVSKPFDIRRLLQTVRKVLDET